MIKKYPEWIDEYARAYHHVLKNVVSESYGPLDAFVVFGLLNGTFITKLHTAIQHLKRQGKSIPEVAAMFSNPSILRVAIWWLFQEYQHSNPKNKAQFRELIEYLVETLKYMAKEDIFCYSKNIAHTKREISTILNGVEWQQGSADVARALGKLHTGIYGFGYALYRDFFPQVASEVYGPYDVSEKFGENNILVMRHFENFNPKEIWPEMKRIKYSHIKTYQIYKDVTFKCELIGLRTIYEGDIFNNLVSYNVSIDGRLCNSAKAIKDLSLYFAEAAVKQSLVYEQMSKEDLKNKLLEWECYQFSNFFKSAGMDWRPTPEMSDAVKDKSVPDRFVVKPLPVFEKYIKDPNYEIYWLKKLYE